MGWRHGANKQANQFTTTLNRHGTTLKSSLSIIPNTVSTYLEQSKLTMENIFKEFRRLSFHYYSRVPNRYCPAHNCGGGVISGFWIFYQALIYYNPPPNYDFGKIIFDHQKKLSSFFQIHAVFGHISTFSTNVPPTTIDYNPPD